MKKSREEFHKQIGEITGTWGKFVSEMVRQKIIELFQTKGIQMKVSVQSVKGFTGNRIDYEVDLVLMNTDIAVIVEIKSTLRPKDVDEHIERMEKIKLIPPKIINLSGLTLYGAVAGMIIENNADRYAYQKVFFVIRQKGSIVEIVNDEKFHPKEWKTIY